MWIEFNCVSVDNVLKSREIVGLHASNCSTEAMLIRILDPLLVLSFVFTIFQALDDFIDSGQ